MTKTRLFVDDYEVKGGYLFRVALALSKRLTVSQALDAGLEVKEADMYSKDEVVRLSQAAMSIIHRYGWPVVLFVAFNSM